MDMTDIEKSIVLVQEKLENVVTSNQDTKEVICNLLNQITILVNRISILERFDIKKIEKLETFIEILKDRLTEIEHKGSPTTQQLIKQQDYFKMEFLDLKSKIIFIESHVRDRNAYWQNIILTAISLFGTLVGTVISGIVLYKLTK